MTAVRWPHTRRRDRHAVYERFDIPGGLEAPAASRTALQDVAAGRLSQEALDDARLMVSELVTNSVRHGGATDGMSLDLSVALLPSVLRVEVADPNGGFDPPPAPVDPASANGHRGLTLGGALATRWGVRRSPASRVWFELHRPRRRIHGVRPAP